MVYVFEDSRLSPSSKLLDVTETCIFTEGCMNLSDTLLTLGKDTVCFVDMVPDNKSTRTMSAKLQKMCRELGIDMIPIPCIEYFLLLLVNLEQIEQLPEEFLEAALYLSFGIGECTKAYQDKSFEKFCKRILSSTIHKCLHNKAKKNLGFFYTEDCSPEHYLCSQNRVITIKIKSETLWNIIQNYVKNVSEFQDRLFEYTGC